MQEVDSITYQPKKLMYQIDIQTGEAAELFSFNANDWLFGAYEDNLIILSYDSAEKEFAYYRYCVKRHLLRRQIDGNSPSHAVDGLALG